MKDKVSVDGVRKEKERLTTDHQPIPGPYLSFHEKWRQAVSVFFFLFRLSFFPLPWKISVLDYVSFSLRLEPARKWKRTRLQQQVLPEQPCNDFKLFRAVAGLSWVLSKLSSKVWVWLTVRLNPDTILEDWMTNPLLVCGFMIRHPWAMSQLNPKKIAFLFQKLGIQLLTSHGSLPFQLFLWPLFLDPWRVTARETGRMLMMKNANKITILSCIINIFLTWIFYYHESLDKK